MTGGEGPHSYAQNSSFRGEVFEANKKLIEEAIVKNFDPMTYIGPTNVIRIADLGCSTGPNAIVAIFLQTENTYFASGVPGSFLGRLFPKKTLHCVHSSSTLHWLSRVPKEIADRSCSAFNKGRSHHVNAPKEVEDAYLAQ
ncbi:loganic acid O-methyltransferase-like [Prosopis cineraria]|uniref:loganic acid O-methyltransferase-like n=1 Tax=Prosopis cineraria TaxID=364024 RepID=UPI00240FC72D|nr:loganic acid O-methyltransferase-like [Prosopis cineraria]